MAIEDYIDFTDIPDDWDDAVKCRRCGMGYLSWEEAYGPHNEKRWVLMESGEIHKCPAFAPAHPNEFPDLTKNSRSRRQPGRRPGIGGRRRIRRASHAGR